MKAKKTQAQSTALYNSQSSFSLFKKLSYTLGSLLLLNIGIAYKANALLTNKHHNDDHTEVSQAINPNFILPMRERAHMIDSMLNDKLNNTLPSIMERTGIDMWILISREYNEDPVLKTMLPATWLSARRRTILVIYNPGEGKAIERYAVARYQVADMFRKAWDKESQPDQWTRLAELIKQKNPKAIGLNKSEHHALADGMTATEYLAFIDTLDDDLKSKIVSAEHLALGWLETRSAMEMEIYPQIVAFGHSIIAQAFSNSVITPGLTTTEDVIWWLRDKSKALGVENWFHPSVSIQRANSETFEQVAAFSKRASDNLILPGDLIHVDFGITYLRLNTDQQQHAYVLKKGETRAPDFLIDALAKGNRLQDIFTGMFAVGKTGNQILKAARQQAIKEGIKPSIYTHPIGYHGHAAGSTLGMWDQQMGVPVGGDYPLHANTAYSIELNAASFIPQWGKEIRIMLEENAIFDGTKVSYMDGRQTEFHLISSDE